MKDDFLKKYKDEEHQAARLSVYQQNKDDLEITINTSKNNLMSTN